MSLPPGTEETLLPGKPLRHLLNGVEVVMKTQSHSHCRICNLQNDCNALPFFWPVFCFVGCETLEALRKNLEFLKVVDKTLIERPEPEWATENKLRIELNTLRLRDFSRKRANRGIYTLILF